MPVEAKKVGGVWRVVEVASGKVATNAAGTSVDGGGHSDGNKAHAQATAINISLHKQGKI